MKEYKCNVIINFEGNHIEAENKEEYIEILIKDFRIQFNVDLSDCEIKNVEVIK